MFFDHAGGVWVARVSLGVVNGKRVGRKVTARTEPAARRELERLQRAYGIGVQPTTGTLDDFLQAWLTRHRKPRASTMRSYRLHVERHISPLLGGIPVAQLRPSDVDRLIADRERYRNERGKRLSPTTIARIITTLRIALNDAVRRGELATNAAAHVELPERRRREVPAMSAVQADRILDAVEGHWLGPIVRLLLGSGLRLGEAVSLNQGDVFPDEAFVRLRESKTTLRAVPVSPDAADALRAALRGAPRRGDDEPLFFGVRGPAKLHRLRGDSVTQALPKALVAAGLPRVTPHGLRHGTASLLVAAGVPMRQIADQLGHSNPALTAKVYAHVLPESLREAVKLLPGRRQAR